MNGLVALFAAKQVWAWLHRLGGVGLFGLGLFATMVPLPGSMDALTIVLSAHKHEWWWYYALMATAGEVGGGFLSYRLASAGGREALEKKLSKDRAEKAYQAFSRWGFRSLLVGAILPPPFPFVPVLWTARAMQYPRKRFLAALTLGRGARFTLVAYVASRYGRTIFHFFSRYYTTAVWTLISVAVIGGIVALLLLVRNKRGKRNGEVGRRAQKKVA